MMGRENQRSQGTSTVTRTAARKRFFAIFVCPLLTFLLSPGIVTDAPEVHGADKTVRQIKKSTNRAGQPLRTKININNISAWYDADGTEEINSATGNSGLVYPKGTAGAIFTAGLMWSGIHLDGLQPTIRTNGNSYFTGLSTGAILGIRTGEIEDPNAPDVRIWRIRKDYAMADLAEDAADLNQTSIDDVTEEQVQAVREQYETDWLEWPAHKGAPFYDVNDDGFYSPMIVEGVPLCYPSADEPGLLGAGQVIWYVANDIGEMSPWGATPSPGLELQVTIWAYPVSPQLSEMIFKRYRLIYKGNSFTPETGRITDMYVGQFSDPDVGRFENDFAGCDTLLNLGYAYNAAPSDLAFDAFGIPPPAIGYSIVQGPLVPGTAGQDRNRNGVDDANDFAIFNFRVTGPGLINLPMSSFLYATSGLPYPTDPDRIGWNQMLRGLPPAPTGPPDPPPFSDPVTGEPTRFWLNGDPVRRFGWIDGVVDGPGDRRIIPASGPFTMSVGDTQEVVIAVVGGLGNDYLNSVTRMKLHARYAHFVHNALYAIPGPPAIPVVQPHAFDRQILLDWEFDAQNVLRVEDSVAVGVYRFEGYKVYQFPDATGDIKQARLLAQYDGVNGVETIKQLMPDPITGELLLQNVQYGSDNGLQRTLAVSVDSIRGGTELVNGRFYYFGVSAYNYTADSLLQVRTYESATSIVAVQPETPRPGTKYPYAIGDTVAVLERTEGNDATAYATIYNPARPMGHEFQIRFDSTTTGELGWTLVNITTGDTVYGDVPDLGGITPYRVIESGFDLFVEDHPTGLRGVTDESGADVFGPLSTNPAYAVLSPTEALEEINGLGNTDTDYEIRFDGVGSWGLKLGAGIVFPRVVRLPFSVWNVGRVPLDPAVEVIAGFPDSVGGVSNVWDVTQNGVVQNGTLFKVFEPLSVLSTPNPGDSLALTGMRNSLNPLFNTQSSDVNALFRFMIADKDSDGLPPAVGTTIRFVKYHETRTGDLLTIRIDSVIIGDVDAARDDVTAIKAFPNPYYGLNLDETSLSDRFITFNHLPAKAVIRIYNLAGIHVRKLVKDDPATQYYRWDLRNEHGKFVGSGIYVASMELADDSGNDLGTKTLKLAIIPEEHP